MSVPPLPTVYGWLRSQIGELASSGTGFFYRLFDKVRISERIMFLYVFALVGTSLLAAQKAMCTLMPMDMS